ncbi:MAG: transglutaminase domain-containing protein, partial [Deltaproteobacteria bacterium]|nr:transglutaminase domain-containing protein [Deltaproteobacteria bacterium]
YKSAAISYDVYTGREYGFPGRDVFNNHYLEVPSNYNRLKDLAKAWTKSETGDIEKIQVILKKLNREYSYAYTLSEDEKKILEYGDDPINNFLFKTKKGTCEHFATALTLMARSVGIKARFVTGFMGVKYNSLGKYYTVTASMAHAWSEVLINGSFVTVDATPPLRGGGNSKRQRDFFRMFKDTLELRWHMYIMDFDESVQFEIKTAVFNELKKIIISKKITYYFLLPVILFLLLIISFVLIKKRGRNLKKTSRVYNLFNRGLLKKRPSKYGYMLYKKLENRLRIINSNFPSRSKNCTPLEYINLFSLTGKQSELAKEIVNLYYAERFGKEKISLSDYKKYKSQIKNSYI